MTISLCVIVKDDAILLPRLLKSVVGIVDEIVIADTGSTDRTVDVINEFSESHPGLVKLLHYEWNQDFSAARNYVLDHASGEWILSLDADEFLGACDRESLIDLLEHTPHDGFLVKIKNYTGSLHAIQGEVAADVVRLFRSRHRYVGSIHEQILSSIQECGGSVGQSPLVVHHLGYLAEYQQMKGKLERNLSLLEKQVKSIHRKDYVSRWFAKANLLMEYFRSGQWDALTGEARLLLDEILCRSQAQHPPYLFRIYRLCALGYHHLGRHDQAVRIALEAAKLFPRNSDAQHTLAEMYVYSQRYTEALKVLDECRNLGDVSFSLQEYRIGTGTFLASKLIMECWLRLGDDLTAREWCFQAFSENQEQEGILPWLVALTPDVRVLHELAGLTRTPQRFDEFIFSYALTGQEDVGSLIDQAEARWGSREALRRARFANDIRQGRTPQLPDNPTPGDYLRYALWLFEQGEDQRAIEMCHDAGPAGAYLSRILDIPDGEPPIYWELRYLYLDVAATRAHRLLGLKNSRIDDLVHFFPFILRTDLRDALVNITWLTEESFHEAWEWLAEQYIRDKQFDLAKAALKRAVLPDGNHTVRGYILACDADPSHRRTILSTARSCYPGSKWLRHIWQQYFSPLPQT
ncbi:MAG: glycosyltransferase [Alicyclobacillus sp.]|nr:glycosyltransferase [Alicyclobacillus sp.]